MELCASVGGGLSLIGTGYWVNHSGFIPASIFISCCSVVPLILTIFLESGKKTANDVSQGSAIENEMTVFEKSSATEVKKQSREDPRGHLGNLGATA